MGQVWHAYDHQEQRDVALKIIQPRYIAPVTDPAELAECLERFRREAEILTRLHHPGIPTFYDAGLDPDTDDHYVAMELVLGEDLSRRSRPALPIAEIVSIAVQLCDILAHLHSVPVIHRDIKPANIMLTDDRKVMLLDLGVARTFEKERWGLTQQGQVLGTFSYLAPEQQPDTGRPISPRSDLYALACVLYELLTGEPPFTGSMSKLIHDHWHTAPVPPRDRRPDTPPPLEDVILKSLAKLQSARPSSAGQIRELLAPLLQENPASLALTGHVAPGESGEPDSPFGEAPPPPAEEQLVRARALFDSGEYGHARTVFTGLARRFATMGAHGVDPAAECRADAAHCDMWLGEHARARAEFRALAEELGSRREPHDSLLLRVRRQIASTSMALGDLPSALMEAVDLHGVIKAAGSPGSSELFEVERLLKAIRDELTRRPRPWQP